MSFLFKAGITFHCVHILYFFNPLIYVWILGLLQFFGYWEWCCSDRGCTDSCVSPCFQPFGVCIQKWNCWSIWYVWFFFVELLYCFPQQLYHFIPTSSAQKLQFLHILANTCYFVFFLIVAVLMGGRFIPVFKDGKIEAHWVSHRHWNIGTWISDSSLWILPLSHYYL